MGLEGSKQQASKHTSAWLAGSGIITFFLLSFSFLFSLEVGLGWVWSVGLMKQASKASKQAGYALVMVVAIPQTYLPYVSVSFILAVFYLFLIVLICYPFV